MISVFCDFDGTISLPDTTDVMLERFAKPEWRDIEAAWERGEIGSAECMEKQVALLDATQAELEAELDRVTIDPGFPGFARFCKASGVPVTIVSDGVDLFIRRILHRHGLDEFPVVANLLSANGAGGYRLALPYRAPGCASGVCKCRVVGEAASLRVYVGDGRSDFCVSAKPEVVFAKGKLADNCLRQGIPFTPYANFDDVTAGLKRLLADPQSLGRQRTG